MTGHGRSPRTSGADASTSSPRTTPRRSAFAQLGPPKAFVTDPTGTHDTAPVFPDGTTEAFLDRFVAGNTAAVTAAPFLAAGDDPYFAYDLGDSIDPHAATSGCAPPSTAPIVLAPSFTG